MEVQRPGHQLRKSGQSGYHARASVRIPRQRFRDQRRRSRTRRRIRQLGVGPQGTDRESSPGLFQRRGEPWRVLEREPYEPPGRDRSPPDSGRQPVRRRRAQRGGSGSRLVRGQPLPSERWLGRKPLGFHHGKRPIRRCFRGRGPLHARTLDRSARERALSRIHAKLAESRGRTLRGRCRVRHAVTRCKREVELHVQVLNPVGCTGRANLARSLLFHV